MVTDKGIRIAFVADASSPHVQTFMSYFVERGYDVHLISFQSSTIKNVKLHYISPSRNMMPLRLVKPILFLRRIKPDILHVFYATHNGLVGVLTGFHPFILTVMGSDVTLATEMSRIVKFIVESALEEADIVNVSDTTLKERVEELGCDSRKILMQEWAVDVHEFCPEARDENLRAKLSISDHYSVINTYRWEPDCSIDVLIKAVPHVLKEVPNVKFVLLGGGSLETELKELAARLGVCKNILFVGKVPKSVMPKYLASVDVIVDTLSDYPRDRSGRVIKRQKGMGIGQANREAMACGTPQILSDSVSFKSYKPFKGLMYKQLDPRDLAAKIIQLLKDKELREKIGRESRRYIMECCSEDVIMGNWERIYHKLSE
jgi:glycosyltransferase involved in cell wall biosynthesis